MRGCGRPYRKKQCHISFDSVWCYCRTPLCNGWTNPPEPCASGRNSAPTVFVAAVIATLVTL